MITVKERYDFVTREEYLAYKEDWKQRYFSVIKQIREAALARREAEREFSKLNYMPGEVPTREWFRALNPVYEAMRNHYNLKELATNLLAERQGSKILAGQLREERLKNEGILV